MDAVFVGTFEHALDIKGRVVLPATFRDRLELGGYITKRQDGCLAVLTPEEFEKMAAEMTDRAKAGGTRARHTARTFSAGAAPVVPDKQGRIAIPQHLRKFADLERDCVVIGAINMIEIWDVERWNEVDREGEEGLTDDHDAAGIPA